MVQLTSIQDYWKNQTLTVRTFAGKVISLLSNMLPRFLIAFLPRRKCSVMFKSRQTNSTDYMFNHCALDPVSYF